MTGQEGGALARKISSGGQGQTEPQAGKPRNGLVKHGPLVNWGPCLWSGDYLPNLGWGVASRLGGSTGCSTRGCLPVSVPRNSSIRST